ncbi:MAG: FAD-dependent oxidoreductase [Pseudomonadota bacterium]|nr:FAD-dependent oxidoreductase [Pseudomonadota bacterium]
MAAQEMKPGNAGRRTVAIIGAGIVGVATAIWLQRDGHDVVLVDRAGPAEGASFGNAGLLASASFVPVTVPGLIAKAPSMLLDRDSPLFLRWSYLPRLLPWLLRYLAHANARQATRIANALHPIIGDSLADHQAMAAGTGAERWIVPSDYLFVYDDRARFEHDSFAWALRRQLGVQWQELEGAALQAEEPAFSERLGFAARVGDHGYVTDPGRYVKQLCDHVVAQGGRLVIADARAIVHDKGRVTGVRITSRGGGGETLACDAAVLAAGAWSRRLAEGLGLAVPLESERGYHLDLWEPSVVPNNPAMISAGKFVVTPMEGRLRLAGIVEFGGLEAPPSRAPFDLLERHIRAAMPGLTWKHRTEWMGHRPATPDSLPVIGPVPGIAGAYLGFGHQHVGLTGAPKTGRILAQLVSGRAPNLDLAPYAPGRFARNSPRFGDTRHSDRVG